MNFFKEAETDPAFQLAPTVKKPKDRQPEVSPPRRGLIASPPDTASYGTLTIEQGQQVIRAAVDEYLNTPNPGHVLLIAAPAGLGKTTLAVEVAERHAAQGGRVIFLGPRKDFWDDLTPMMQQKQWWQRWLPRTEGQGQRVGQTCRHASKIGAWMQRGYEAMAFCTNQKICGWDYVRNDCPWHQQTKNPKPIIFGQFEHAIAHPLSDTMSLMIGDELPLRAMLHTWKIPAAFIVPTNLDDTPQRVIMQRLRWVCDTNTSMVTGDALMQHLGGAEFVAEATAGIAASALAVPELTSENAVEDAPYNHIYQTLLILGAEAQQALQGRSCVSRIQCWPEALTLLIRRVPEKTPSHVIWLDATGSPDLYSICFGRPVKLVAPDIKLQGKVFQVWASLNTKRDIVTEEETPKGANLRKQVQHIIQRHGYRSPALITYQHIIQRFGFDSGNATHFHGSRGTNRLQDHDALIVVGTPQPAIHDIANITTQLFSRRTEPLKMAWTPRDRQYASQPWSYSVSGFWDDPDMQLILEQHREAELIQALHRVRPLRRNVDVWLLTNLPLPRIPVTLVSLHELYDAPKGIDAYRWPEIVALAQERVLEAGYVTSADLVHAGICKRPAAARYLQALSEVFDWPFGHPPTAIGRGKPPLACGPLAVPIG
jgi:DNA polymerase III delta prime subunit